MSEENIKKTEFLVPGVYTGVGLFPKYFQQNNENKVYSVSYPCAISIGWNPMYENSTKTVEVFIINKFENDFYGEDL